MEPYDPERTVEAVRSRSHINDNWKGDWIETNIPLVTLPESGGFPTRRSYVLADLVSRYDEIVSKNGLVDVDLAWGWYNQEQGLMVCGWRPGSPDEIAFRDEVLAGAKKKAEEREVSRRESRYRQYLELKEEFEGG